MPLIRMSNSKYWYLDYREAGKRKRVSSGTPNKKIALKMLEELRVKAYQNKLGIASKPKTKFLDFFEVYLERNAHKITIYNDRVNGYKHLIPFFGLKMLHEIRPGDVENFKSLMSSKRSTVTANRMLALIRRIFNLAVDWEYLDRSPFKAKLFKEHGRERVLSEGEEVVLMLAAKDNARLLLFIQIAFATGARAGEIKKLTWNDVDLVNRVVKFTRTKNGSTRPVALNSHIAAILQQKYDEVKDIPCAGLGPVRVIGLTTVTKAFRAACVVAGIETAGQMKVTPHTIRHTVATRLSQAGVDLPTIGAILGHSQPSTIFKYAHPGSQVTAVEKLTPSWSSIESSPTAPPGSLPELSSTEK